MYLQDQLAKALQDERLRTAARHRRAAEARRARTARPDHAAATKAGATARGAAQAPGKHGAITGPRIHLGALLPFRPGMVPAVLKLARALGRIWFHRDKTVGGHPSPGCFACSSMRSQVPWGSPPRSEACACVLPAKLHDEGPGL